MNNLKKGVSATEEFLKPKMTFGDTLRFTAYAYAKLLWMRDRGPTEVAGYCVTAIEDPLLVTDFVLIKQKCTCVTFDLDTEDIAEYAERMMDAGIPPWACLNILAHSHPSNCSKPSPTDEKNFKKAFSHPHWAIMLILAEGGATYCRLKINVGPGVVRELKVSVDWSVPFCGSNIKAWDEEYEAKVTKSQYDELKQHVNYLDCEWDEEGNVAYWNDEESLWYYYDPVTEQWSVEGWDDDLYPREVKDGIDTPKRPWVKQVLTWAEKYAHERILTQKG